MQHVQQLNDYKAKYFPFGAIVQVNSERFKGIGISVGKSFDCAPDKVMVRVESGNTWEYPIECCDTFRDEKVPRWILDLSKDPWWENALLEKGAQ